MIWKELLFFWEKICNILTQLTPAVWSNIIDYIHNIINIQFGVIGFVNWLIWINEIFKKLNKWKQKTYAGYVVGVHVRSLRE